MYFLYLVVLAVYALGGGGGGGGMVDRGVESEGQSGSGAERNSSIGETAFPVFGASAIGRFVVQAHITKPTVIRPEEIVLALTIDTVSV